MDAFLSSPAFHSATQKRRSLTLALGAWLGPRVPEAADLETALARARRWRRPRGPGLALANGAQPIALQASILARRQALRGHLGPEPVTQLVAGELDLDGLPGLDEALEHWVVTQEPDGSTGLLA